MSHGCSGIGAVTVVGLKTHEPWYYDATSECRHCSRPSLGVVVVSACIVFMIALKLL